MEKDEFLKYQSLQAKQFQEWEATCGRCAACCGTFDGDPCEHLAKDTRGRYICRIYENRFGMHKTVGGRVFRCVPIRDILHLSWPGDSCCGYKKTQDR